MFLLRSFCFTENLCLELDTEVTHGEGETEKRSSSSRQRARARERERINQSYDMACVYIPVQNSEEEVRVALDMLPRDAADILDILKAEQAPLDLWLIIAVSSLTFYFNFPQIHSNFSLVLAIVVILFIYLILLMMMHCRGSTSNKEKLNNSVKFWRKVQALVILSPTP